METDRLHARSLDLFVGQLEPVEFTLPSGRKMVKPSWWRETTEDDVMANALRLRQEH